jgi:RNA polymerase sigma factor (sigma-70 family)
MAEQNPESLLRIVSSQDEALTTRADAFEKLLSMSHGFWQSDDAKEPETLMHFTRRIARWVVGCRPSHRRPTFITHEDLAHDVLLTFFESAHRIRRNPRSWIIGVAACKYRVALRKESAVFQCSDSERASIPEPAWSIGSAAPFERSDTSADHSLRDAISHLPPKQREVYRRLLSGCSRNEIADELQLSPAAMRQHISRGKRHLASALRSASQGR